VRVANTRAERVQRKPSNRNAWAQQLIHVLPSRGGSSHPVVIRPDLHLDLKRVTKITDKRRPASATVTPRRGRTGFGAVLQ